MSKAKLLSLYEAIKRIESNLKKNSNEDILLHESIGRCLSEPIVSSRNNPNFDSSSMDGYAINTKDYNKLKSEINQFTAFNVIGESSAGKPYEQKINTGEVVRIYTGAKLPMGSDAVVIQENVRKIKDQKILINVEIKKNQNVRKKGLDLKKGQKILSKGTILNSRHVGSIAMTGNAWVTVTRKPVISILSTGNEILKVGEQLTENQIPSGNNLMIASMISELGGIPRILPVANDNQLSIYNTLNDALDSDLIVTTGGVSVGKYDLIQKSLLNFKEDNNIEFWKIAMRPGKPLLFSIINNTPLLGLPGNPVSSGVCSFIFLNIAIKIMLGTDASFPNYEMATLEGNLKENDERMDFVRASLINKNGNIFAAPFFPQDSSMIHQFSLADCLILRNPFEKMNKDGDKVRIIRFPSNI
jgi:molybdopterin molybdotransferase|tara:strand:+ start:1195 stop:2439 length:1245 start_codon:yes stop_codon:yes gene_type:complete